jgi:hypothetical protein
MNKRSFIKTGLLAPLGALVPVDLLASNQKAANEVILRPHQQEVFDIYKNTDRNIFCWWGEGVGKTFLFNLILSDIYATFYPLLRWRIPGNTNIKSYCGPHAILVDDSKEEPYLKYRNQIYKNPRKIFFVTPQDSRPDMFSIASQYNEPSFSYYISNLD